MGDRFPTWYAPIYTPLENLFSAMGLMAGPYAPLGRFIFGFASIGLALHLWKPEVMYHKGRPRPWVITSPKGDGGIAPTIFPWWLGGVIGGIMTGVFI
jgi:hypothetical protein